MQNDGFLYSAALFGNKEWLQLHWGVVLQSAMAIMICKNCVMSLNHNIHTEVKICYIEVKQKKGECSIFILMWESVLLNDKLVFKATYDHF